MNDENNSLEGNNLEENSNLEENNVEENLPVLLFLLVAPPLAFIFGGLLVGIPVLIVALVVFNFSRRPKDKKGAE